MTVQTQQFAIEKEYQKIWQNRETYLVKLAVLPEFASTLEEGEDLREVLAQAVEMASLLRRNGAIKTNGQMEERGKPILALEIANEMGIGKERVGLLARVLVSLGIKVTSRGGPGGGFFLTDDILDLAGRVMQDYHRASSAAKSARNQFAAFQRGGGRIAHLRAYLSDRDKEDDTDALVRDMGVIDDH